MLTLVETLEARYLNWALEQISNISFFDGEGHDGEGFVYRIKIFGHICFSVAKCGIKTIVGQEAAAQ